MDSPRGNTEDPQNAALHHPGGGQDEGELHVGKQSLYKKVKIKAKKMKETFKGHGHDNDVDDDNVEDDNVDGGHENNLDDHAAPGREGITSQHETNISERAANGDHDESTQKHDLNTGQQEDKYKSIGNQDQFSAEAVTKPQLDATIPTSQGFHDEEEQKPESYNDKVSFDSSTNADSTVSFDQQPDQDSLDKKPVAGGYRETVSNISSSITNTAVLAKDAVASKLGYGETKEQSGSEYQVAPTNSSSISSSITNTAVLAKDAVASKLGYGETKEQSGSEYQVAPTNSSSDKGALSGKAKDTDYDDGGPGLASPGKSVMERLRVVTDAAGSWFNKSGGEPHVEPRVESGDRIEEGNDRTQAGTIKETGLN